MHKQITFARVKKNQYPLASTTTTKAHEIAPNKYKKLLNNLNKSILIFTTDILPTKKKKKRLREKRKLKLSPSQNTGKEGKDRKESTGK